VSIAVNWCENDGSDRLSTFSVLLLALPLNNTDQFHAEKGLSDEAISVLEECLAA
jgi:hypothetical protein